MSFLGALGYIMSQNRLRNHLETVYASNSVIHMLTCHAYNRVIRICYQQLLLWLICLIHPTIDMNKYQDKIPTRNAIKNICMIDVLHKKTMSHSPHRLCMISKKAKHLVVKLGN